MHKGITINTPWSFFTWGDTFKESGFYPPGRKIATDPYGFDSSFKMMRNSWMGWQFFESNEEKYPTWESEKKLITDTIDYFADAGFILFKFYIYGPILNHVIARDFENPNTGRTYKSEYWEKVKEIVQYVCNKKRLYVSLIPWSGHQYGDEMKVWYTDDRGNAVYDYYKMPDGSPVYCNQINESRKDEYFYDFTKSMGYNSIPELSFWELDNDFSIFLALDNETDACLWEEYSGDDPKYKGNAYVGAERKRQVKAFLSDVVDLYYKKGYNWFQYFLNAANINGAIAVHSKESEILDLSAPEEYQTTGLGLSNLHDFSFNYYGDWSPIAKLGKNRRLKTFSQELQQARDFINNPKHYSFGRYKKTFSIGEFGANNQHPFSEDTQLDSYIDMVNAIKGFPEIHAAFCFEAFNTVSSNKDYGIVSLDEVVKKGIDYQWFFKDKKAMSYLRSI